MARRRKALLFCALAAAPFFPAVAGPRANLTKIVSRDFDVCELRPEASKLCLSQYVDFDGGNITYRGVDIEIYIGGHPNTDGLGIIKEPVNGILEQLYAGQRKGSNRYVLVYGFLHMRKFGEQKVEIPNYVTLSVRNSAADRAVAQSVGSNLVRCTPNH